MCDIKVREFERVLHGPRFVKPLGFEIVRCQRVCETQGQ